MKLHILGGPGSGKSFIAQKLAERFTVPVLDLDEIFWDHAEKNYGSKADSETRDSALRDFIAQDEWIVEGAYYRWCAPSFQAADYIFVLTPPLWLRQVRIIQRFFRRKIGLEKNKKETFRGQIELMAWSRNYDGDNLARATAMLKEANVLFIECATLDEILRSINKAEQTGAANPCPSGTSVTEAACAPSAPEASSDT